MDENDNSAVDIDLKMKLKLAEIEKRKEAREENVLKVELGSPTDSVSGSVLVFFKYLDPYSEYGLGSKRPWNTDSIWIRIRNTGTAHMARFRRRHPCKF